MQNANNTNRQTLLYKQNDIGSDTIATRNRILHMTSANAHIRYCLCDKCYAYMQYNVAIYNIEFDFANQKIIHFTSLFIVLH